MFKYTKTIPFYDVDPMQVAWHGNYVKYFEEARCAFLSQCKMTYKTMEKMGYAFPIVEMKIKYIHPCFFNQQIDVETELISCTNFLVFKYTIRDHFTNDKLCKAETKQMCIDIKSKESLFEIPTVIQERLTNP